MFTNLDDYDSLVQEGEIAATALGLTIEKNSTYLMKFLIKKCYNISEL